MSKPFFAQTLSVHDLPVSEDPHAGFWLGIANAAPVAVAEGDACAPSFTLARRLRVDSAGGTPGAGRLAIHVAFSNLALAGTSVETVYTTPAARLARITSVVARYVGAGAANPVTLQLQAAGIRADIVATPFSSGININLLGSGREILLNATETLAVIVDSGSAGDDLFVDVHGEELTV